MRMHMDVVEDGVELGVILWLGCSSGGGATGVVLWLTVCVCLLCVTHMGAVAVAAPFASGRSFALHRCLSAESGSGLGLGLGSQLGLGLVPAPLARALLFFIC